LDEKENEALQNNEIDFGSKIGQWKDEHGRKAGERLSAREPSLPVRDRSSFLILFELSPPAWTFVLHCFLGIWSVSCEFKNPISNTGTKD
jgi:hypothetical protein